MIILQSLYGIVLPENKKANVEVSYCMLNTNPPVSQFALKKTALLKRFGIYNTPVFIPVFFQSRSGSTVLGETLNTHAHCQSLNEAFANYLGKQLPLDYQHFLKPPTEQYFYRHALKGKHLTHTFLQFNEWYFPIYNKSYFDYNDMFSFVGKHFPAMVFISRRNQLKRIVSNLRSKEYDFWHETPNSTHSNINKQIYLNVNDTYGSADMPIQGLAQFIEFTCARLDVKLTEARKQIPNLLELVYEDDIEPDVMIGVNKILDYFNIPASYKPLKVPLVKTSRGLKHDLENYDEVREYLANTPYAWMIEEE